MAYGSSNYRCMREQADSKSMKVRAPVMSETEEDVINDCLERSPNWRAKAEIVRHVVPPNSFSRGHWYEMGDYWVNYCKREVARVEALLAKQRFDY